MAEASAAEAGVKIINKKGLHARAAAKFVKTAGAFDAVLFVIKTSGAGVVPSAEVSGNSILGLMMLGAECNSTLHIRATGAQAAQVVEAIKKLIEEKFGED